MLRSNRGVLAMGLGLVGVAALVGRTVAQNPDNKARTAQAGTPAPAAAAPSISVGSIDIERVFKEYEKVKVSADQIKGEALMRQNELMKLAQEAKQEQEKYQKFAPTSPDAKRIEERLTQLEGQFEAGRKNAEREFTQKETEVMAGIYNEIVDMAKGVAAKKGMTFLVKYSDNRASGAEPNSAMATMSRTIIYADPRYDVTTDTIRYLNAYYKQAGTQARPAPATQPAMPPTSARPSNHLAPVGN